MTVLPKPLRWRGSSQADFSSFPREVQRELGYALYLAQMGERHVSMAKTLKGFGGGAVIEIKESDRAGTYRAIYTVRFAEAIYVLHAFQKKSKHGIRTPDAEMATIERRLKELLAEKAQ